MNRDEFEQRLTEIYGTSWKIKRDHPPRYCIYVNKDGILIGSWRNPLFRNPYQSWYTDLQGKKYEV